MLGYEHYAGSMQNARNYMTGDRLSKPRKRVSKFKLGVVYFEADEDGYSWLDVFFRDDIHIIGLKLDYTEAVLWWAITYKKKLHHYGKNFQLGQTYYHYMPETNEEKQLWLEAKLGILSSLGVQPVPLNFKIDS